MTEIDAEVAAISSISSALVGLEEDARVRVLKWAWAKFLTKETPSNKQTREGTENDTRERPLDKEIPGVALVTKEGYLKITARDIKAKSTIDAAVRLAHIAIKAYCELTGQDSMSSRKVLTPLLKEWRAYDGNTRRALSTHRGILREGDNLMLDAHAKKDAERFVTEILDDEVQGTWKPAASGKKRTKKAITTIEQQ